MTINFSVAIKNARLQMLCDAIDAQETHLILYNEAQEEVCNLLFPSPSKSSIANGQLIFRDLPESMVLINAEAKSAKIIAIDNTVLASLSVGDSASSEDLKLPSTILFAGSLLRLKGWLITEL
ncbi:hypothetical protein CW745_13855 [Psychromonas sp. psych-6C06]|uniref:hypothetical protein n=1 Tax=Psychromonas sp. psych-6C06 TaxID=2058089 RepID=UPI000C326F14|nr:hypothetical protein [Psychromonas sp. psych-6C06]PKF60611.1 hypothetical protein CW745_13855 [Psychromonas sp. psych-6C06]